MSARVYWINPIILVFLLFFLSLFGEGSSSRLLAATFVQESNVETERLGTAGTSYVDPEILQSENLMVFQSAGDVWLTELSPETGGFVQPDGQEILVDQEIASLTLSKNGPEFGISEDGWSIYYNKLLGSDVQIFRADVTGQEVTSEPLTFGSIDRINQLASQNPQATAVHLVYGRGEFTAGPASGPGASASGVVPTVSWLSDNSPSQEFQLTPLVQNVAGFRWAAGTSILTTTVGLMGEEFGQILMVDAETGLSEVITNDEGVKFDPYGWRAPEFNGELLVLAALNNSCIGIYRDTGEEFWERIVTIETPPDSELSFIQSSEPFVAAGRSFISTTVKRENAPVFSGVTESEIWIYGIEADIESRFYLRCDNGEPNLVRHEAETFLGNEEVFLYYNKINPVSGLIELYLCRTGIPAVLLGDINQDGSVNLLDVHPFVELLSTAGFQPEADLNRDSVVNLLDVAPFVRLLAGPL